jgi:O-antigen ligase
MSFIQNNDILTLIIILLIILCMIIPLLFWSLKRYEIVITLMLLSPLVSWIFSKNIPVEIEEIQAGSSSYIRVSMVLILGMIGYLNFFKLTANSHEKVPLYLKLFAVFLFCALLSTTYSIDRFYTFTRASEFIAFYGFLLGLFYWIKNKTLLDKALNIYSGVVIFGIIINILSLVLFPDRAWYWKSPDRFLGVAGHPNALGAFCMLSYPALIWKYKKTFYMGRFFIAVLFCSVLFMHIISGSRSSLVTSIFGLIVWYFMFKNKVKLPILFAVLVFLCGSFFFGPVKMPSLERKQSEEITDLTGRTDFWKAAIQLVAEKPMLGYGYGVAGKVWSDPRYRKKGYKLWMGSSRTSLHNGYLNIIIGSGIILFFVFLTVLLTPVWRLIFTEVSAYNSLALVTILQILLLNMAESTIAGSSSFPSLVFWFFWVIAARSPDIVHSKNN